MTVLSALAMVRSWPMKDKTQHPYGQTQPATQAAANSGFYPLHYTSDLWTISSDLTTESGRLQTNKTKLSPHDGRSTAETSPVLARTVAHTRDLGTYLWPSTGRGRGSSWVLQVRLETDYISKQKPKYSLFMKMGITNAPLPNYNN